jgi:hypothetical protein
MWGLKPSSDGLDDWVMQTPPDEGSWAKFLGDVRKTDPKRADRLDSEMKNLEQKEPFSVFAQRWEKILANARAKDPKAADQLANDMFQSRFPGKTPPKTDDTPRPNGSGDPDATGVKQNWTPDELEVLPDMAAWDKLMASMRKTDPKGADELDGMIKKLDRENPTSVFIQRYQAVLTSIGPDRAKRLEEDMFKVRFPGAPLPEGK